MASRTRFFVSSLIVDLFWMTRVTVEGTTPASFATSLMVTRMRKPPSGDSLDHESGSYKIPWQDRVQIRHFGS